MDGITVVNTIQGIVGYSNGITAGFVIMAFLCFMLIALAVLVLSLMIKEKMLDGIFPLIICIGLAIILGAGASEQYHAKPVYGPQQVVLVDDDVSLNEFMDRYVIVAHEGELYTIYEK